jgi:DnaJ-class molecular chaperone
MKCEICGKDKVKTTCSNCGGDGSEPFLVIFSRTCQACNGKGIT